MAPLPSLAVLGLGACLAAGAEPRRARPGGLALRARPAAPSVHFLYTTGCNDYQLIHSAVLDHTWRAVGNTGRLTRVVTACKTPEDRELMSRSPLRDDGDFAVFFAEGRLDVIPATGERYPARSRPYAIGQWFEKAKPSEDVVCLVDPDFAFVRPITQHPSLSKVRRGRMVSSSGWEFYGDLSGKTISMEYRTGPVWLIETSDLRTLLPEWKSLTDSWEKVGDGLMREQFAFQASAEKHKVPADFVGDLATEIMEASGPRARPYALHYFRSYRYGRWGFHKSLASSGWYADHFNNSVPPPTRCGAPMLQEPPPPQASEGGKDTEALTMFTLLPLLNSGLRAYRETYCRGEREAFRERGAAAFGLARLMHPISCAGQAPGPQQLGEITRYRVDPALPASWDEEQALGGEICSHAAQMFAEEAPRAPGVLLQHGLARREPRDA